MGAGKTLAVIILSLMITLSLSLVVTGMGINKLLYPQVYFSVLEKNNGYNAIEQTITRTAGITIGDALTTSDVKAIVNKIVINSLSYIRGETATPDLAVTIEASKIREILSSKLAQLPECMPDQNPYVNGIECRPSGTNASAFTDMILAQNNIENGYSFNLADYSPQISQNLSDIKSKVEIFHTLFYLSLIMSLILGIFLMMVLRKSIESIFKTFGSILLVTGLSSLSSIFILKSMMPSLFPVDPASLLYKIFTGIIDAMADTMLMYGILITFVGIILIVFYLVSRKKE